jgi:hypothetical protein
MKLSIFGRQSAFIVPLKGRYWLFFINIECREWGRETSLTNYPLPSTAPVGRLLMGYFLLKN